MNNSTHFHNKKICLWLHSFWQKCYFEDPDFHKVVLIVECWIMFQPILSPPWCYGIYFKPSTVLFDFKCISLSIEGGKRKTAEMYLSLSHHGFSNLTAVLYSMTVWSQSPSLISSLKCFSASFLDFLLFSRFVMDDWEEGKDWVFCLGTETKKDF